MKSSSRVPNQQGRSVRGRAIVGTLVAATALLVLTTPAWAAKPTKSTVFAGYVAPGGTTVTTTYVVPTLSCGAATRLTLALVYIPDIASPGQNYIGAGVLLGCSGGVASYRAIAFGNGAPANVPGSNTMAVAPGDTVVISATAGPAVPGSTSSVVDNTSGMKLHFATGGVGAGPASIGLCSGYSPAMSPCPPPIAMPTIGPLGGVPKFKKVITFTAALVNGTPLGSHGPTRYDMVTAAGKPQVDTSALTAGGTVFNERYR